MIWAICFSFRCYSTMPLSSENKLKKSSHHSQDSFTQLQIKIGFVAGKQAFLSSLLCLMGYLGGSNTFFPSPKTSFSLTKKQNTEFFLTCLCCRLSYSFPLAPLTESKIPLKLGNSWQCFIVLIYFKLGWHF